MRECNFNLHGVCRAEGAVGYIPQDKGHIPTKGRYDQYNENMECTEKK